MKPRPPGGKTQGRFQPTPLEEGATFCSCLPMEGGREGYFTAVRFYPRALGSLHVSKPKQALTAQFLRRRESSCSAWGVASGVILWRADPTGHGQGTWTCLGNWLSPKLSDTQFPYLCNGYANARWGCCDDYRDLEGLTVRLSSQGSGCSKWRGD